MIEQSIINLLGKTRTLNSLAVLVGVAAMSYAYYLQYHDYLDPCPLCIFDRVFLLGVILCALAAAIHNPKRTGQRVYALLILLSAAGGLTSSGRHVWLQHLPADQVPACGPGLNYILDTFPLGKAMEMIFRGSGECAEIHWQFLGFTLPEVSLMMFIAYSVFAIIQLLRRNDDAFKIEIQ